MEISLFSKCVKELILENDRVDVPYLGTFTAELMPASYSDRQTTIHPPYRKMSFHKENIALADGRPLLDRVRKKLGVSLDQAGVELGWCLSRLSSELEGRKTCRLPGLGTMRANARNEFYFVPDDDLDIWPDGLGFEPIPIKVSEKTSEPVSVEIEQDHEEKVISEPQIVSEEPVEQAGERGPGGDFAVSESPARRDPETQNRPEEARVEDDIPHRLHPAWIALIVLGTLLILFIAASYLFTDQMSPILDRLLYSKEELELLQGR